MGSNSKIQGYNMYPMLHFCRKFSSSVTMALLTDLTYALCWSNSTFTLFSASLDMEIRLEQSSGVCSTFSKVIFLFVPLIHVSILAFFFPVTLKIDSLVAARPIVGWYNRVSDMNDSLLTKQ